MGRLSVLSVCLLLAGAPVCADELRGRVIGVTDGDTLTLLDGNRKQHKIRLNGIDAPEAGQAFGQVSRQALSAAVFGQDVRVVWSKVDLYGRLVGTVLRGQVDANLEQLRTGLAWYFRHYERDVLVENRAVYAAAEAEARAAKLGLWRDERPQPPWEFRRPASALKAQALASPVQGSVIGNRNSNIYHVPGCMDYDRVAERNRVYFKTEGEAQAAGFHKARNCG